MVTFPVVVSLFNYGMIGRNANSDNDRDVLINKMYMTRRNFEDMWTSSCPTIAQVQHKEHNFNHVSRNKLPELSDYRWSQPISVLDASDIANREHSFTTLLEHCSVFTLWDLHYLRFIEIWLCLSFGGLSRFHLSAASLLAVLAPLLLDSHD